MLKINKKTITEYAQRYDKRYKGTPDELIENELKDWFEERRYLDKENFVKLGIWKTPRQKKNYKSNSEGLIKEITKFSLLTKNKEARIESLTALNGVLYPVASVILHFAFPDRYPIMDFRAIWSLGWQQPKYYTFEFWQKYCKEIKTISNELGLPIRTVDKALWEYSKENQ